MPIMRNLMALYRARARCKQRKIERYLSLHQGYLSRIEHGYRELTKGIVQYYTHTLGMSIKEGTLTHNTEEQYISYPKDLSVSEDTLVIFPGNALVAISYFTRQHSHFISMTLVSGRNNNLLQRLCHLIQLTNVSTLIVPEYIHTQSRALYANKNKQLIKHLLSFAHKHNIATHQYAREDIQEVFKKFKVKYRYEIADLLARWIPRLRTYLYTSKGQKHFGWRYVSIFNAVSLIVTHVITQK